MFDTIEDILKWAEVILTLLSGGMVFNLLAIFLGLFPWFVSLLLWCAFEGKRLSKRQTFIFGNATAGIIVAAADLAYRQYFNNGSTLRDVANWISPFRGGQFMFLPLWLLGIANTALAASCLAGGSKFFESLFEDNVGQPLPLDRKTIDGESTRRIEVVDPKER